MREPRRRGHIYVLRNDEHPALLQRVDDSGDALSYGPSLRPIQHGLHRRAALLESRFHGLGVERREHGIAPADPVRLHLATPHRLIDIQGRATTRIRRPNVAFLVSAHSAASSACLPTLAVSRARSTMAAIFS